MKKFVLAVMLSVGAMGGVAWGQGPTPAAGAAGMLTSAAVTDPAPAAPATQPSSAKAETIGDIFGKTRVGQMFEGKQKVTFEDVKNPVFWIDTVRDLILAVLTFIPRLIVACLFLVFFWTIYRAVRRLVMASMAKAAVDESIRDMLGHLIKWSIMGFGLVVACNQIGVQIAALLTAAGVIGLAVGFAAQETLANFIAGIVIFWDKPFRVGDWLEVGDTYGQVKRVTFRSTRLLDIHGQMVIFPNTHMLAARVSNHTTHPLTRVAVPIGIAYKESIDAARAALLAACHGDERIAPDPAPSVVVAGCGDSSVNLLLSFWITDESLEKKIVFEYLERCKKALDAASIQIPFPHMQLFVEDTPAIHSLAGSAGMRKAG
jgi:small conductance mechanosensitive channel